MTLYCIRAQRPILTVPPKDALLIARFVHLYDKAVSNYRSQMFVKKNKLQCYWSSVLCFLALALSESFLISRWFWLFRLLLSCNHHWMRTLKNGFSSSTNDPFSLWSSGKSWQADGNLHLYRTDYLVTDHLAGKFYPHRNITVTTDTTKMFMH